MQISSREYFALKVTNQLCAYPHTHTHHHPHYPTCVVNLSDKLGLGANREFLPLHALLRCTCVQHLFTHTRRKKTKSKWSLQALKNVFTSAPQLLETSRGAFQTPIWERETTRVFACVCVCVCVDLRLQTDSLSFYVLPLLCDEWVTHAWHFIGGSHVRCSSEGWLCDRIYACIGWPHKHRVRVAPIYTSQAQALCVYGIFLTFQSICCSTVCPAMQAHCFQEHMRNNHLQRQEGKCDLEH